MKDETGFDCKFPDIFRSSVKQYKVTLHLPTGEQATELERAYSAADAAFQVQLRLPRCSVLRVEPA